MHVEVVVVPVEGDEIDVTTVSGGSGSLEVGDKVAGTTFGWAEGQWKVNK